MNGCIFCKIARGEAPANILHRDEHVVVFSDIQPITPVHILVVPHKHIESINSVGSEDQNLLGHMLLTARDIARKQGMENSGYRLVINTGNDGGQSVFHLHLHVLGGRKMPFHFNE